MKIKVLFMGRKLVSAQCLRWLAAFKDVEIVGCLTDSHLEESITRETAMDLCIPIMDYETTLEKLKNQEFAFDLGLSVLFWRKLRKDHLVVPKKGIINFHPAPLPDYKGTAGYNLAILEGLKKWGVTAHYMDEMIDTGRIIRVSSFGIDPEFETVASIEKKCAEKILADFKEVVDQAVRCDTRLKTSDNIGGRYVSRSEMEAMKELKPGDDVARKVRAFWYPPYEGAWISVGGKRYTLVSTEILSSLGDPQATSLFSKAAKSDI